MAGQIPIAGHGMIANGRSAALVGRGGRIDWLCWPEFDSPACFAATLGTEAHGFWDIAPVRPFEASMRYRPGTLVLETEFRTADGVVMLSDAMVPGPHAVLRRLRGVSGTVAMRMRVVPRFGYGVVAVDPREWLFSDRVVGADGVAEFGLGAGETAWFAWGTAAPDLGWEPEVGEETVERRSVLTLLGLCSANGAMLAAPTTSLPERMGGVRNWDYRFCWLRDSALAARSLLRAGELAAVGRWRDWVLRTVDPLAPRALYPVTAAGETRERTLDWLPGHGGARPVRVGNGAAGQLQIDAIGGLILALLACREAGLGEGGWDFECGLLARLEAVWALPDEGMWEVRGGRRHFTHSKVMAWAAFDRAIAAAARFGFDAPVGRWVAARAAIREMVLTLGFDAGVGSFTQSFGRPELDASLLLLPAVGFLPASDPRMLGTVAAVSTRLLRGGFLLRYDTADATDGLPQGEGAFLPCSFWLADAWAREGRLAEARALYRRLCGCANALGLLSEEIDPASLALLGNFPQGFSHLALLDTAYLLRISNE